MTENGATGQTWGAVKVYRRLKVLQTTHVDLVTNNDRGSVPGHSEGNSANSTGRIIEEESRKALFDVTV